LSGYFSRFGEVAAHRASQCIDQDAFHLMDGLGGQSVIVKVTRVRLSKGGNAGSDITIR
jgi:hypothetical protein